MVDISKAFNLDALAESPGNFGLALKHGGIEPDLMRVPGLIVSCVLRVYGMEVP